MANGPKLSLEYVKEAINGQGSRLLEEEARTEALVKTAEHSDMLGIESYSVLPGAKQKLSTSPQALQPNENIKPAEDGAVNHQKESTETPNSEDSNWGSHTVNSLLETPTEEKLPNGSVNSSQFENDSLKRDSDSGSTSASESMDLNISLSTDLSLNRGSESHSLKVRFEDCGWGRGLYRCPH